MRRAIPALLLAGFAAPSIAQTCDGPVGPIETCVVGAWIGSSTIPEAMERAMQAMPDNIRANFNDFGRPVAAIVYDDGFFQTFPMGANGVAAFRDAEGDVTTMDMIAQTQSAFGYVTAMEGLWDYCHLPGGAGGLVGQMTITAPSTGVTLPLAPPPGPETFQPVITYTCSGNSMTQNVALPAPLGTITYTFNRVAMDTFPEAMRLLVEDLPGGG